MIVAGCVWAGPCLRGEVMLLVQHARDACRDACDPSPLTPATGQLSLGKERRESSKVVTVPLQHQDSCSLSSWPHMGAGCHEAPGQTVGWTFRGKVWRPTDVFGIPPNLLWAVETMAVKALRGQEQDLGFMLTPRKSRRGLALVLTDLDYMQDVRVAVSWPCGESGWLGATMGG